MARCGGIDIAGKGDLCLSLCVYKIFPVLAMHKEGKIPWPRIGRFPPFGKRFFDRARKIVRRRQMQHLWRAVVAIAAMEGRKSLSRITAVCKDLRTRQALSLFLTEAQCVAPSYCWIRC